MNAPLTVIEADRSLFLGGSDAAAVMGVSPWNTPVDLWMQKTRRTPRDVPDARRQKIYDRGHKLEPFIREMVIDKMTELGLRVELVAINQRYVDPEHPFLSCEIDFELRLWGVLEINGADVVFDGEMINCDAKSVSGVRAQEVGRREHRRRADRVRRAIHAWSHGLPGSAPALPGRRAAQLRRCRHLLDAAR